MSVYTKTSDNYYRLTKHPLVILLHCYYTIDVVVFVVAIWLMLNDLYVLIITNQSNFLMFLSVLLLLLVAVLLALNWLLSLHRYNSLNAINLALLRMIAFLTSKLMWRGSLMALPLNFWIILERYFAVVIVLHSFVYLYFLDFDLFTYAQAFFSTSQVID